MGACLPGRGNSLSGDLEAEAGPVGLKNSEGVWLTATESENRQEGNEVRALERRGMTGSDSPLNRLTPRKPVRKLP